MMRLVSKDLDFFVSTYKYNSIIKPSETMEKESKENEEIIINSFPGGKERSVLEFMEKFNQIKKKPTPSEWVKLIQSNPTKDFRTLSEQYSSMNVPIKQDSLRIKKERKKWKKSLPKRIEFSSKQQERFYYSCIRIKLGGEKAYQEYKNKEYVVGKRKKLRLPYNTSFPSIPTNAELNKFREDHFLKEAKQGNIFPIFKFPRLITINGNEFEFRKSVLLKNIPNEFKIVDIERLAKVIIGNNFEKRKIRELYVDYLIGLEKNEDVSKILESIHCKELISGIKSKVYCYAWEYDEYGEGLLYNLEYCIKNRLEQITKLPNFTNSEIPNRYKLDINICKNGDGTKKFTWSCFGVEILSKDININPNYSVFTIPALKVKGKETIQPDIVQVGQSVLISDFVGKKKLEINHNDIDISVTFQGIGGDNKWVRSELGRKMSSLKDPINSTTLSFDLMGIIIRNHKEKLTGNDFISFANQFYYDIWKCLEENDISDINNVSLLWRRQLISYSSDKNHDCRKMMRLFCGSQYDETIKAKYFDVFKIQKDILTDSQLKKYFMKYEIKTCHYFVFVNQIPFRVSDNGLINLKTRFLYPIQFKELFFIGKYVYRKGNTNNYVEEGEYGQNITSFISNGIFDSSQFGLCKVNEWLKSESGVPCFTYCFHQNVNPHNIKIFDPVLHFFQTTGIEISKIITKGLEREGKINIPSYSILLNNIVSKPGIKSEEVKRELSSGNWNDLPFQYKHMIDIYNMLVKYIVGGSNYDSKLIAKRITALSNLLFLLVSKNSFITFKEKIIACVNTKRNENKFKRVEKYLRENISDRIIVTNLKKDKNSIIGETLSSKQYLTRSHRDSELPYVYPKQYFIIDVTSENGKFKMEENEEEMSMNDYFKMFSDGTKLMYVMQSTNNFVICKSDEKIGERNVKHRDLTNSGNLEGRARHGGSLFIFKNFIILNDDSSYVYNTKGLKIKKNKKIEVFASLVELLGKKKCFYYSVLGMENVDIEISTTQKNTIFKLIGDIENKMDESEDRKEVNLLDMFQSKEEIISFLNNNPKLKFDNELVFKTLFYNLISGHTNNLLLYIGINFSIGNDELSESYPVPFLKVIQQTNFKKNVIIQMFLLYKVLEEKQKSLTKRSRSLPDIPLFNFIVTQNFLSSCAIFGENVEKFFLDIDFFVNNKMDILILSSIKSMDFKNPDIVKKNCLILDYSKRQFEGEDFLFHFPRSEELMFLKNYKTSKLNKLLIDIISTRRSCKGKIKKNSFNYFYKGNHKKESKKKVNKEKNENNSFLDDRSVFSDSEWSTKQSEMKERNLGITINYIEKSVFHKCYNCKNDCEEKGEGALLEEDIILSYSCVECRRNGFNIIYSEDAFVCPVCKISAESEDEFYKIFGCLHCDECKTWFHRTCLCLSEIEYKHIIKNVEYYVCKFCKSSDREDEMKKEFERIYSIKND